jgi:hypothetical protein
MGASTATPGTGRQRIAAAVALLCVVQTLVLGVLVAISRFAGGLEALACVAVVVVAAWFAVVRRRIRAIDEQRDVEARGWGGQGSRRPLGLLDVHGAGGTIVSSP